jgi:hypothetical protein
MKQLWLTSQQQHWHELLCWVLQQPKLLPLQQRQQPLLLYSQGQPVSCLLLTPVLGVLRRCWRCCCLVCCCCRQLLLLRSHTDFFSCPDACRKQLGHLAMALMTL